MGRLYWDSCIFIYYLEADEATRLRIRATLQQVQSPSLCHTALTELECRVEPLRSGKHGLLSQYDRLFSSPNTQRLALDDSIYRRAAELRAAYRLKTPDALHLAAALEHGCDSFLDAR
jgi:predicted nucleic acid-binding protein